MSGSDMVACNPVVEAQVTVVDPAVVETFVSVTGVTHPPPALPDPPKPLFTALAPPPPPDVPLPFSAPLQEGELAFNGVVNGRVAAFLATVNMESNSNLDEIADDVLPEF